MSIEELEKQVKENAKRLDNHLEEIKKNGTNISHNHQKIQQNSYALDILKDYKEESKRWFKIALCILGFAFFELGFIIYLIVR